MAREAGEFALKPVVHPFALLRTGSAWTGFFNSKGGAHLFQEFRHRFESLNALCYYILSALVI